MCYSIQIQTFSPTKHTLSKNEKHCWLTKTNTTNDLLRGYDYQSLPSVLKKTMLVAGARPLMCRCRCRPPCLLCLWPWPNSMLTLPAGVIALEPCCNGNVLAWLHFLLQFGSLLTIVMQFFLWGFITGLQIRTHHYRFLLNKNFPKSYKYSPDHHHTTAIKVMRSITVVKTSSKHQNNMRYKTHMPGIISR